MKTSVLLLTTLVAAALFTAVLGGPYRGQRYDDQARDQSPGPVDCPNSFSLACSFEPGVRVCQEYYECAVSEECCNARFCPPGLGVCSSVYAKIESHDVPLKVKDENLAKEQSPDDDQARDQSPGPVDCPNSCSLACDTPGARLCQENYPCPFGQECCNGRFCPPGLGVCSSVYAKIESHDVPLKVKDDDQARDQSPGPVDCPNSCSLACDTPGARLCQENYPCPFGQECCNGRFCPPGLGVCSSVYAKIESHDVPLKVKDDDQARDQSPGPLECPNSNLLSCFDQGVRFCQEYYQCAGGEECCNAVGCPPGLGVCSSFFAKIESHDVPLKVEDENPAKEQSPGPMLCHDSHILRCYEPGTPPGAKWCNEPFQCIQSGIGSTCCVAFDCPPGVGVCSAV